MFQKIKKIKFHEFVHSRLTESFPTSYYTMSYVLGKVVSESVAWKRLLAIPQP